MPNNLIWLANFMSLPFFISFRYIQSKKHSQLISLISLITILGISLGVAVLILSITILDGFEKAVENKIVGFNEHIVISGYSNRNLPDDKMIRDDIAAKVNPFLNNISPFISKNVIIKSKSQADGVFLFGVEENTILDIPKYIKSGLFEFESKDSPGLVIGQKLANRLKIVTGDKITIMALRNDEPPSFKNPPSLKQFVVTGIYESGMAEYDDLRIFTSISIAKKLFSMPKSITGYNIKLNNISKIDSLEQRLQEYLSYPFYVQSIYRKHQNIFTWLELQKKPIPIILAMVILVAAFNMIGTLLMIVLERTSDVGLLKSLGMKKRDVLKIFLYQGTFLSIIGVTGGNLIALILTFLQLNFNIISLPSSVYFLSSVPISVNLYVYLIVSISALFVCFLTTIIPGYIASKLNIITAIRFN